MSLKWQYPVILSLALLCACSKIFDYTSLPPAVRCIGAGVTSVSSAFDNHRVLISYCDGMRSYIAFMDYITGVVTPVVTSSDGAIYLRPIAMHNTKRIIFIARRTVDTSSIYAVNFDGSELMQLTTVQPDANNIIDIALSSDDKTLYYINSRIYTASSPLAKSAPHRNDIYSIELETKKIAPLSEDNAYSLSGLAVSADKQTIYTRSATVTPGQSKNMKKTTYTSDPRLGFMPEQLVQTSQFPLSQISDTHELILACGKAEAGSAGRNVNGYGLYRIDTRDMRVVQEIVYLPAYLTSPAVLADGSIIFVQSSFLKSESERHVWAVNKDGSNLRKISLTMKVH